MAWHCIMSLSTTTTATYELVKYSRAYNHSTPTTPSEQAELQWQHFVNPVIRLLLDTIKASDGRLKSYKVRIVWTFSTGQDSMDVDGREVVFVRLLEPGLSHLDVDAPTGGPRPPELLRIAISSGLPRNAAESRISGACGRPPVPVSLCTWPRRDSGEVVP